MRLIYLLFLLGIGILHGSAFAMETHREDKAGTPISSPSSTQRTVPELVCNGTQFRKISHSTLDTELKESAIRLRLRGNVLYLGQSVSTEKFSGLINKTDRLRWTSGRSTLVLNENFESGTWTTIETVATYIYTLRCAPFDSSRR